MDKENVALAYFHGDEMAASVWEKKYALHDDDEKLLEKSPEEMHRRMAKYFADVEAKYDFKEPNDAKMKLSEYGYNRGRLDEERIFKLFDGFKRIVPGGSVMSGLGCGKPVSLSNCWVIAPPEDSIDDIFRVCNEQSQLFKRRGGNGFDISKLRPNGAKVHNSAKYSSGAVSFMDLFSTVTLTISQMGRRGALMISMHIDHPDAEEFIEKKQDLTKVTGANVSVQIGDDFMRAVMNDEDYIQRWPIDVESFERVDGEEYDKLYETVDSKGGVCYYKKVRAKRLWDKVIHCAWNTGEPGILFKTRHYEYSPDGLYPQFRGTSTNPCLVGDTMIQTDKGLFSIKDIVERMQGGETFRVLTFNEETMEGEYNNVTASMKTRENADVIEIETEDGEKLRLTPDHRVYTENRGWVEASKLTNQDILCKSDFETATTVKSIKNASSEDVYDLTVENNHNFFANGLLVHNCGEIFMNEDSCRLIHVNLSSFILNEYTDKACVDDEALYETFYEATRLGDDLVDLEEDAINGILKKLEKDGDKDKNEYKLYSRLLANTLRGRRCGVGLFGLSDAVAKLGHKFDSDEGLEDIKHISRVMFTAELDSEIDMAITRGAFPSYDASLEAKGNEWYEMLKRDYPHQYERMKRYGRRNVSFGTAAPTGSVAILAQCSSGIEPLFMPYYVRRVKCTSPSDKVDFVDRDGEKFTEYITVHQPLRRWAEVKYGDVSSWGQAQWEKAYKESPWFGSTANDIDWTKRVKIQGIVQDHITHSISSTINLPNSATEEEVSTIYQEAWKQGLKGITVYRDGCRSGVIVSVDGDKKKNEKPKEVTMDAKRRPKTLEAKIVRFNNKGDKWVGIVGMLDGKPYELFTGMLEKLNIPSWVENGVIIKNYEEVDVDGVMTRKSRYDLCYNDKDGYRVCVEGVSRIFNPEFWNYGKLISGLLRHNMPIAYIVKVISSLKLDDSSINTWKNGVVRALKKFESSVDIGEKCPECGGRLVRENGCIHCIDCGYSKCG